MLRRVTLFVVSLSSIACAANGPTGPKREPGHDRPPNVVLIFADDLGYGDVGFNGRKEWATPNIDRLAKEGTIFRRWYTAGVVCRRAAPRCSRAVTGSTTA